MINRRFWLVILASLVINAPSSAQSRGLVPSQYYIDYGEGPPQLHLTRWSRNRKLASIGDTLYMLGERNRIVWKWSSDGRTFTDLPVIDSTGTIYVIGLDMMWVAIDAATGQQKWSANAVGRASFSQMKPYGRDMYLVVTNMGGYRDNSGDRPIEDRLSLCKGTKTLWTTQIPANSRIRVSGERVFVVLKQKKRTSRWQVNIPRKFVS